MSTVIYALVDPRNNEARYVGKTNRLSKRYLEHINSKGKTHRDRWIQTLRPLVPTIIELECSDDWVESEVFWIAYMKALGANLTNHTIGGEGLSGCKPSAETRAKKSAAMKKLYESPEMRKKRSDISKQSQSDPEYRSRRSASAKQQWSDPEYKKRCLDSRTWQQSEQHRKIMGEATKAAHARPEVKANHKAAMNTSETRAKLSEAAKHRVFSPEIIEKRGAAIKAAMSTPEYRAKRSQIAKDIHAKRRMSL